jgi:hypothetical protein
MIRLVIHQPGEHQRMLKNTSPTSAVTIAIVTGVLSALLGVLIGGARKTEQSLPPEHPLFGRH